MLSILNGFDEKNLTLDVGRAAELCGSSRASTYRYLQALTRSGLLTPASGGNYIIGSRVIELEMLKRENDPLARVARHLIRFHSEDLELNVMLCNYYGDKVLCTDFAWTDHSIPEIYKRGRSMPIFKGAMAKVILANLSISQLKSIYAHNSERISENGLGDTIDAFMRNMSGIRSAGYCITHAEVFPGLVGVAAPVNDTEGRVLGSVVLVVSTQQFEEICETFLIDKIKEIAADIERSLQRKTMTVIAARPRRNPAYRD
ncbi:IclR family transcriptional regulator [Acuticoccus kandeliae]|uniref:IclR family transcriptional regulator n=1 Tax=Acuticoccus kandeliae TaxID=2073160 RepID=UPI0014749CA0|nr:IclR family transcriptional regulator C-terminal domain-containing protein [Acuticoccus kandeliae]